jgi:hypothetical protein
MIFKQSMLRDMYFKWSMLRNVPTPTCAFLYDMYIFPNKIHLLSLFKESNALQLTQVLSLLAASNKPLFICFLVMFIGLALHKRESIVFS